MLNYPQARVLNDYVLVRRLAAESRTAGGLIKPEDARDRPQLGVVLAVGPGARHAVTGERTPITTQVGDLVTFNKFAGIELDEQQNVWLMRETELGVSFAPAQFDLVTHEDPKTWHLADSFCEECDRKARAVEAVVLQTTMNKLRSQLRETSEAQGHVGKVINLREGTAAREDGLDAHAGEAHTESAGPERTR